MQDIPGKVLFTFNAWTSDVGDPYLSITGHYITAPPDCPEEWELKNEQLAFTPMPGSHTSVNIANLIIHVIDKYGLQCEKVRVDTMLSHSIF
jgi:hypothetical protein